MSMQDKDFYAALAQVFPALVRSPEISSTKANTQVVTALWIEVDSRLEAASKPVDPAE